MLSSIAAALLLPLLATAKYSCTEFDVPVSFTATHLPWLPPVFENHYQTVAFLNDATARNSASYGSPFGALENITVEATISAKYCLPTGKTPTTVQILTHGLGFDKSYWDFGGPGSQYNYIDAATSAGHATLSYDRLSNGASTLVDPYQVQQLGPQTGVAIALTTLLRSGTLCKSVPIPQKVVHVGHSYGSSISNALIAFHPELSDGVVLTGYSTTNAYGSGFLVSGNFHIAAENQARLSSYNVSDGYLTWGDELSNQYSFFHYPGFDPKVLAQAEATKYPFSVAEPLTGVPSLAKEFTGPVLLIAGEYDLIFCGADCPGLLKQGAKYFPKAAPFEHYIQKDTGHGMNLHYNATGFFAKVQDFIATNV